MIAGPPRAMSKSDVGSGITAEDVNEAVAVSPVTEPPSPIAV